MNASVAWSCAATVMSAVYAWLKLSANTSWKHWGSGCLAPPRWWVITLTQGLLFPPGKDPPVPFEYDARWYSEPVWTFYRREKSFVSSGIRTPIPRPGSLVTISNTLTRLLFKSCVVINLSNSDSFVEGVAAMEGPFYFHPNSYLNHCVVGYCIVVSCSTITGSRRFGGKSE